VPEQIGGNTSLVSLELKAASFPFVWTLSYTHHASAVLDATVRWVEYSNANDTKTSLHRGLGPSVRPSPDFMDLVSLASCFSSQRARVLGSLIDTESSVRASCFLPEVDFDEVQSLRFLPREGRR